MAGAHLPRKLMTLSTTQPQSRLRVATALVATLTPLAMPVTAGAQESAWPTRQHTAANAEFLPWASPPQSPVGVCLIDTGVTPNTDLVGLIAHREGLDGESPDDHSSTQHGTAMALAAVARPDNDFATIGAAGNGAVRITSIRASRDSSPGAFRNADVERALRRCRARADIDHIRVVSLSLGGRPLEASSPGYAEALNAINLLREKGINVVAAAGNDPETVASPGSAPGVLTIAARPTAGADLCSFSGRGAPVDLAAPGCGLDFADPVTLQPTSNAYQGSSPATAFAAAVLAALRAYRPDLTAKQAEEQLVAAAPGGALDTGAAFANAGLIATIDEGHRNAPMASDRPAPGPSPSSGPNPQPQPTATTVESQTGFTVTATASTEDAVLPVPRVVLGYRNGRLRVSVRNRPRGAIVEVQVRGTRPGEPVPTKTVAHVVRRVPAFNVRVRRADQVRIRFRSSRIGRYAYFRFPRR